MHCVIPSLLYPFPVSYISENEIRPLKFKPYPTHSADTKDFAKNNNLDTKSLSEGRIKAGIENKTNHWAPHKRNQETLHSSLSFL